MRTVQSVDRNTSSLSRFHYDTLMVSEVTTRMSATDGAESLPVLPTVEHRGYYRGAECRRQSQDTVFGRVFAELISSY